MGVINFVHPVCLYPKNLLCGMWLVMSSYMTLTSNKSKNTLSVLLWVFLPIQQHNDVVNAWIWMPMLTNINAYYVPFSQFLTMYKLNKGTLTKKGTRLDNGKGCYVSSLKSTLSKWGVGRWQLVVNIFKHSSNQVLLSL